MDTENKIANPTPHPAPSSMSATENEKQANAREKKIKASLHDYFSQAQDARLAELRIHQHAKTIIKTIMFFAGAFLALVPVYNTAITEAVDWPLMFEKEGLRFILPGSALVLIAFIPLFWTNRWYRPLALVLAIAAITFQYLELGNYAVIIALGAIAILMLAWDLWDWWVDRRDPKELRAIEGEIDARIEQCFDGLIKSALPDLPVSPDRLHAMTKLKTFPKADRIKHIRKLARIGTDKKPRISPVGLAAFQFGQNDILMFEGAINLIDKTVVYARIHEFRYDNIIAMSWSSDVSPPDDSEESAKLSRLNRKGPMGSKKKRKAEPVIRRDEFQICLSNGDPFSILFRDSTIHRCLKNAKFAPIEDLTAIKKVWEKLEDGKQRAHAAPRILT